MNCNLNDLINSSHSTHRHTLCELSRIQSEQNIIRNETKKKPIKRVNFLNCWHYFKWFFECNYPTLSINKFEWIKFELFKIHLRLDEIIFVLMVEAQNALFVRVLQFSLCTRRRNSQNYFVFDASPFECVQKCRREEKKKQNGLQCVCVCERWMDVRMYWCGEIRCTVRN